ncbi:tetratricopeptide repeat protein [Stigmatella sp. ncwal1]|uniref:Tetratricopeptide repeat protein n=1 Tax=Stigmatella ashevillensis TaxID=2995309 RepID=A0ABT5DPP0_9BACT|nr:tetratricopeptide repeat protein [Stigmatella ashevillena]MDC0714331.1 tetratricopeptide repeat protein [Stigmatella ashevillena]
MAKSMVERYEQLLLQDPSSSVFVELAKVLLEKGDISRAISTCEQGVVHHPHSIIGRVLWGKALLQQGRPAQAMEQFDQAVAIDKENPHAYNLIGEVLVQRGLYRSALPILRKAVALQPNDARVRVWLEQTQQSLTGGPPPVVADLPGLTANALTAQALSDEPAAPAEPAAAPALQDLQEEERPEVTGVMRLPVISLVDEKDLDAIPPPPPETDAFSAPASARPTSSPPSRKVEVVMFPPKRPSGTLASVAAPPPPPAGFGGEAQEEEQEEDDLEDTPPYSERVPSEFDPAQSQEDFPPGEESSPEEEEAAAPLAASPAQRSSGDSEPAPSPSSGGGGLLGDLPPPEELAAVPAAARISESARSTSPSRKRATAPKRALLEDIPDAAEPRAAAAPRAARASDVDAAASAAAYEKELREKLAKTATDSSFLSRHGVKLIAGGVCLVVLTVFAWVYISHRAEQGGRTLAEVLARTERVIALDTSTSLEEALTLLDRAREMDDSNSKVWALTAYTHALLFADHGAVADDRQQALAALEHPGVRAEHQGLSLATDVLVADEKGREATRRALLNSSVQGSVELDALAGSLLLEMKQPEKAVARFQLVSESVRALVALGRYYQEFDDIPKALNMYANARKLSPEHPQARIGMAESQLVLDQDLGLALADMEALGKSKDLVDPLRSRQQLIQGRLLTELGRYDEALALLANGTKGPLAFEFYLASGDAGRAAGKLEEAQQSYEAALKLQPRSEDAREGLGRTLLDRDRVKEVLARLDGEGRKVALVRAAAHVRQEDWKRARAELEKTRVNNRYPLEAVGYLALADTMEGNGDQAREILEKAVNGVKKPRTDLRVALGRVYWRQRSLDKAQAQFEEAMKDPRDYEASCSEGRLLLARGLPDMALKPLTQAVERNGFHGEARDALGRALLALGRTDEGFKQFERWRNDNPDSAKAQKGFSLALFHTGKFPEAVESSSRAVKLDANDAEAHRLRAVSLFATGDGKGAFTALSRANSLDPRDPETFCEIGHAFLRQGDAENAAAAFGAARREGPDVTCGQVGEHYVQPSEGGRAAAKALQGIFDRANAVWDKAFAQTALARVLLSAGDVKGAHTAAAEAVKLAPFSGRAQLALGLVALRQRQEEPARTALTKAVELDPANGMARLALADLLVRKSEDLPQAIKEYESFLKLAGGTDEAKRVKKALPPLKKRAK